MTPIRRLLLPACLGAAVLPVAALADDYRAELDLTASKVDFDIPGAPDVDALGIAGTYYFSPVVTDGMPLAEAAFLRRSSFVGAGVTRSEVGDEKIDIFGAGIGYYLPNTIFYGELNYTYLDDFAGDQNRLGGALGVAPIDGLLVTTSFDEDGWDPNATARYVGRLPDSHFYAASVSIADPDDGDLLWGVGFDYYFDSTFSVGANLGEDSVGLRAEKFFTPRFALSGFADFGDDELGERYGARVSWRF